MSPAVRDRWGFSPLVEAHRFQHTKVVLFLAAAMRDNLPSELEYSMQIVEKIKRGDKNFSLAKEISLVKLKPEETNAQETAE